MGREGQWVDAWVVVLQGEGVVEAEVGFGVDVFPKRGWFGIYFFFWGGGLWEGVFGGDVWRRGTYRFPGRFIKEASGLSSFLKLVGPPFCGVC